MAHQVGIHTSSCNTAYHKNLSFEIRPNEKFVTLWMRVLAFFGHAKSKSFIESTKPINVISVTTFDSNNGLKTHTDAKSINASMRVLKYQELRCNSPTKCIVPTSQLADKLHSLRTHYRGIIEDGAEVTIDFYLALQKVIDHSIGATFTDLADLQRCINQCKNKVATFTKDKMPNPILHFETYTESIKYSPKEGKPKDFQHPKNPRLSIKIEMGNTLKDLIYRMIHTEDTAQFPSSPRKRDFFDYLNGHSGYKEPL